MDKRRDSGTTLKDVARVAGVHPATVSRALDPTRSHLVTTDTRAQIQAIAEQLGYTVNAVARSLRKGASGLIGVVVADVGNPFLPPVLRGIEHEIRSEGLVVLIAETHEDSQTLSEILDHFASRRLDAIILAAAHAGDYEIVRAVSESVPIVLAVRSVATGQFPTVTHDDVLGGKIAARHLVELGHRDLAQLRGPSDVSSFVGRAAGFESVMSKTVARDLSEPIFAAQPTVEEGYRLASALLRSENDRPTAIFAHNDLMAVGAIEAIHELGLRCPEDVSVVGYNDAPLSNYLSPPLTTIKLPSLELGRRAAQVALALLRGEENPLVNEQLPPEIVIRSSTAAPPQPTSQSFPGQSKLVHN